jgi:hypothetical protein
MRKRSGVTMKPAAMPTTDPPALPRRKLLGAAGTAGALAVAAAWVTTRQDAAEVTIGSTARSEGEPNLGYRLSEHVQRYYQTTKV